MEALLGPVHNPYALPGLLFTSRIEAKIPPGWQTKSPVELASWATAPPTLCPSYSELLQGPLIRLQFFLLSCCAQAICCLKHPFGILVRVWSLQPVILHSDDPIFENYSRLLPLPPFQSWRLTYLHENILPDLQIRYSCISLLNYKPLPDYLNPWDLVLDMTLHRNPRMSQGFQDPWSWNSTVSHTFMSHLVLIHQWCYQCWLCNRYRVRPCKYCYLEAMDDTRWAPLQSVQAAVVGI